MRPEDLARPELWEPCDCPLCETDGASAPVVYAFELSQYRRCPRCRLVFLNPRLREEAMISLYGEPSYFEGMRELGYDRYEADAAVHRRTFRRRVAELARFAPGGRWLDVGCGMGLFLEAALEAGRDPEGLEIAGHALAVRPEIRERIRTGTLEQAAYPDACFDAVTLFDVFEHIYRPRAFAGELARIVRPEGVVVVATPNYDSWLRRLLGRRSVSFKIPEHVCFFTPETLGAALGESFARVHAQWIGQYCSWPFLKERLSAVSPALGGLASLLGRIPGIRHLELYVPSGSVLAIFARR